jgi:hypothetical protein
MSKLKAKTDVKAVAKGIVKLYSLLEGEGIVFDLMSRKRTGGISNERLAIAESLSAKEVATLVLTAPLHDAVRTELDRVAKLQRKANKERRRVVIKVAEQA